MSKEIAQKIIDLSTADNAVQLEKRKPWDRRYEESRKGKQVNLRLSDEQQLIVLSAAIEGEGMATTIKRVFFDAVSGGDNEQA